MSAETPTDFEPHIDAKIILDHDLVRDQVDTFRQAGKRIVLTQGSWDLIHIGHARYIRQAKKLGDVLVVGADSDEKIKKRKGPERPIVPEAERVEMLAHLRYVDLVTVKQVDDPKWNLIKVVRPDVLIITERMKYNDAEVDALKEFCGELVVLDSQATTSTSAKIRLLQMTTAKKLEEALKPKLIEIVQDLFADVTKG